MKTFTTTFLFCFAFMQTFITKISLHVTTLWKYRSLQILPSFVHKGQIIIHQRIINPSECILNFHEQQP
jgi:hypothetical protein